MSDDRIAAKREAEKESVPQRKPRPARDPHRDDPQRKPGPIERGEWRGSGVCGDRHTD